MINRILPFLNKLIPAGLAISGISKVDPRLGSFAQNALAVGYTSDQILDYLREKMEPGPLKNLKSAQAGRALRPDEKNVLKRHEGVDTLQRGITAGAGLIAGLQGFAANKALGMAQQIPQAAGQMAQQAQGNVSPNPSVAAMPISQGQPQAQAQQGQPQATQQTQQAQQSPLDQLAEDSPQLAQGLMSFMKMGQSPDAAAAIMKNHSQFARLVRQFEARTKQNFVDYVAQLFGGQQQAGMGSQQMQAQGQQQAGQGQQKLMAMVQQLQQMRGRPS